MNNLKYPKALIAKACRLYDPSKRNGRATARKLGIRAEVVHYHCNPKYNKAVKEANAKWRASHPDRLREIGRKAMQKWYSRHPEDARARARKQYWKDVEKSRERMRVRYAKNRVVILAQQKKYRQRAASR